MTDLQPRIICDRCRRPQVVCYCSHVPTLPTRTRVLLLQHPRESRMAIGTARMAHLALPGSELRVGTDFAGDPVVRDAVSATPLPYVLFPGADARDVRELDDTTPITLIVLDGTWSLARKLLRLNPALAALPRVAFIPKRPSDYRIRRQPAATCVSTIEALAEVLEILEPPGTSFDRLLEPFRAMVDGQERFQREVHARRHLRPTGPQRPSRRELLAARLRALGSRLVCVQGEANAWAARDPRRQPPEIVHWVAERPLSGERFDAIVAPRRPLAPATWQHVQLPPERMLSGQTLQEWQGSWDAFLRPDDVLLVWGTFYRQLAADEGLRLPDGKDTTIDLRTELCQMMHTRVGTLDDALARVGAVPAAPAVEGRAGRRLAGLVALVQALVAP